MSYSLLILIALTSVYTCVGQAPISEKELSSLVVLKATPRVVAGNTVVTYNATVSKNSVHQKFRRRFEYILLNYTDIDDSYFTSKYPDTLTIQNLYVQSLLENSKAYVAISTLYLAVQGTNTSQILNFTKEELWQTAASFFAVKGMLGPAQLDWRVCISLEKTTVQMSQAQWLLEAFCFEAIFENLRSPTEDKRKFMENFLAYIASEETKLPQQNTAGFMEQSKAVIISKMRKDKALQNMLLSYYQDNKNNLPFTIEL